MSEISGVSEKELVTVSPGEQGSDPLKNLRKLVQEGDQLLAASNNGREPEVLDLASITAQEYRDSLVNKMKTHPNTEPSHFLDITDDELRALPFELYQAHLAMINLLPDGDEIVAKHLPLIVDRFVSDTEDLVKTGNQMDTYEAHQYGNVVFRMALHSLGVSDIHVSGEQISRLFELIEHKNHIVRHNIGEALDTIVVLDNRNRNTDEWIDLNTKFVDKAIEKLTKSDDPNDIETGTQMMDVAWGSFPFFLDRILIKGIRELESFEEQKIILREVGNRVGMEEMRQKLRNYAQSDRNFEKKLDGLELQLFGVERHVYADLAKLYSDINFREYKPNAELNEYETNLLVNEFNEDDVLMDIAAGPGRLMHSLTKRGRKVVGFDFVKEHVQQIKEVNPEAEVYQASWHAMPFKDESVDGAYCLGRSFLHNTTIDDGLLFLREARRVLKDEGKLIIDLPDSDKGNYAEERVKYAKVAQELGIYYYESGSLNDSPDSTRYFDRLAPLPDQFKAMAAIAGFKAEIMNEHTFTDSEGQENNNMYWKLTKTDEPIDITEAVGNSRTGKPALSIKYL